VPSERSVCIPGDESDKGRGKDDVLIGLGPGSIDGKYTAGLYDAKHKGGMIFV
jgi:hypothetical protein